MAKRVYTNLTALYEDWNEPIVTAHRGLSGIFPENTAYAMRKAIERGTDMIEFDVQMSRDGVPIILHDRTLDRTSNLTGLPSEHDLAELKEANFSYQNAPGKPLGDPRYEVMQIPTFEELLQEFRGKAGMNIQVYTGEKGFSEVCRLYCEYEMFDQGYLMLSELSEYQAAKAYDKRIEVCYSPTWKERASDENLALCKSFGCRFAQPVREFTTPENYAKCRELGIRANTFYTDTEVGVKKLLAQGATGMLTNRCDVVLEALGR